MRDNPRSNAGPGKTEGTTMQSGLSDHEQIKDSPASLGEGQGQGDRPKPYTKKCGKGFKFKG